MFFRPRYDRSEKEDLTKTLNRQWALTPHNMQNFEILVVNNKDVLDRLGNIKSHVTETFLRENYQSSLFFRRRTSNEEGRPFWNGISFIPCKILRFQRSGRQVPTYVAQLVIDGSPMILSSSTSTKRAPDSEDGILRSHLGLGCVMENMWLMATSWA